MALYQLILAYDGTEFSGFQRQGNSRTVQGVFESALHELDWQERTILFAGRTDAGVHAAGQVVSFSLDWQHSSVNLRDALNARLPEDVSVIEVKKEEAEFHPRYDAFSRTYHYSIYQIPSKNPLLERFAWRVWPKIDGGLLFVIAPTFLGQHDFSSFGRAMKPGGSTIREIFQSHWQETETGWRYDVEANAFLYHMVRRLVYVQVQFAKGKLTIDEIENAVQLSTKLKPGLAPAQGLVLQHVTYEETRRESISKNKLDDEG